jgi:hypothetical protein
MRRTTRLVNAFAWKPFAFGFGLILGGSVAYYRYHLDEVPLTHRRRFLNVSKTSEVRLGQAMFENILVTEKKNIVRENQALIEKILQRLSSTSDIPEFREIKWRVLVLNNPQPNAFVLPGGFCVVFTGIFPVCKNVDGLAVVLSHEAAHVLARHGAERLSKSFFMFPIIMLVSNVFGIPLQVVNAATTLLLELPNSRLAESEADEIGIKQFNSKKPLRCFEILSYRCRAYGEILYLQSPRSCEIVGTIWRRSGFVCFHLIEFETEIDLFEATGVCFNSSEQLEARERSRKHDDSNGQ